MITSDDRNAVGSTQHLKDEGSFLERIFFNHRYLVILFCFFVTIFLGLNSSHIQLTASFDKTQPSDHQYIKNFREYSKSLTGSSNVLRVVVENVDGTIYDQDFLSKLKKINDELYLYEGVERSYVKSIWMSAIRWIAVTEEGLEGGPVMPSDYDGSEGAIKLLKRNVERAGIRGQLIANDEKSAVILVPLLETDYISGQPLDYELLNSKLEEMRSRYESENTRIYITGFAKVSGDLINGLKQILIFFAIAILIATVVLYWYTRCVRSTILVVLCSLIANVWLLGLLPFIPIDLNPYSILVPFLIFAIGMSHGAQKMNGIMQDIGRGTPKLIAARLTFRRLFLAGLTALLADAVGFAVLIVIYIPVIQELAITASIGVFVLIFTNLVLLPVLLSFTGVSQKASIRSLSDQNDSIKHPLWQFLDKFTQKKWASIAIFISTGLVIAGLIVNQQLKIGDLDAGAPELRSDSRYNKDNDYIINHYSTSSDVYTVIVPTPAGLCSNYTTLLKVQALEDQLRLLPSVQSTVSFVGTAKKGLVGFSEGNMKWYELSRNQSSINSVTQYAPRETLNATCTLLTIQVFLDDHKADTLHSVATIVDQFAKKYNDENVKFLSAAGNAGIEAATNSVVEEANRQMLFLVYAAVILLAFITFRSWRAVLCAILPLILTSILCESLMVMLGIGVKVATLPVVALGVGIGVDYALYILTVTLAQLRQGASLSEAYYKALTFTGRVVVLTGLTLAIGVGTWFFSPIKFQADMGILLAYMFLWNMLGALILIPSLSYFLLKKDYITGIDQKSDSIHISQ